MIFGRISFLIAKTLMIIFQLLVVLSCKDLSLLFSNSREPLSLRVYERQNVYKAEP